MRSIRVLTILALTAGLASAADVSVHQRFGIMSYTVDETQYFTAGKVIIDNPGVRMIVDLQAKTVTSANKNDKYYTVKTFDDLRREAETQRAKSKAQASAAVTLEPTGKTQKVAGHKAKEYTIKSDTLSGSMWVADDLHVPPEAVKWGRVAWTSGDTAPDVAFQEALAKLKGLPLFAMVTKPLGPATWTSLVEATEVGKQAPPAEILKMPEEYVLRTQQPAAPTP